MMKRSTTKTFIKKEIKTNNIVNVNDCIWGKKSLAMNTRPASRQTVSNGQLSLPCPGRCPKLGDFCRSSIHARRHQCRAAGHRVDNTSALAVWQRRHAVAQTMIMMSMTIATATMMMIIFVFCHHIFLFSRVADASNWEAPS